jgi:phosphoribosylanthranilate isomerase
MIRVKICGITRPEDALDAAREGADFIGMVFAESPRRVSVAAAAEIGAALAAAHPTVGRVGVFVSPGRAEVEETAISARLTHVQIHGRPPGGKALPFPWIAALALTGPGDARAPEGAPWAVLVEPKVEGLSGGTGLRFPWEWARPLLATRRVFVAGGLDSETVGPLLRALTPYGVDASSRLEKAPGIKDPAKVRAFIRAVRKHTRKESTQP